MPTRVRVAVEAERHVLLVLVVGIIFLLCGLVRLGFVIAFISHSVMTGFVFGLAIYIAVSQVPKLFGLSRAHGETLYQLWHLIGQLGAAKLGNLWKQEGSAILHGRTGSQPLGAASSG
jgi:MFS superfamily sulfate permease-like transporter